MHARWFAVLAVTACGRIGFDLYDPVDDGAAARGDAPISGLVGWWKLDEGAGAIAHDSIGSDDGTFSLAELAWTTGCSGGSALAFPGHGEVVSLGEPSALANRPGLTVAALLKPTSVALTGNDNCFFDHGSTTAGWAVGTSRDNPGDVSMYVTFATTSAKRVSLGGVLAVGTWTRIVATWDGTEASTSLRLYSNGVEVGYADAEDGSGARIDDAAVSVEIGCSASTSFAGAIADVRVYERALSPSEVAQL